MNNEFTKKQGPNETRYILEFASGGGTSSASIASSPTNQDSILVQSRSGPKEVSKPRNFVAKHAQTSGAGAHKDRKKAAKQGDMKHKKSPMDMSEGYKFKGGFPFDVDHMNGPRGIGLSSVETKYVGLSNPKDQTIFAFKASLGSALSTIIALNAKIPKPVS